MFDMKETELFYQKFGVSLGFNPNSLVGIQQSKCFEKLVGTSNTTFTMVKAHMECPNFGLVPDLAALLLDIMGVPKDMQILHLTRKSYWGTLLDIQKSVYDTTFPWFAKLEKRLTIVDFATPPLFEPQIVYTTRYNDAL